MKFTRISNFGTNYQYCATAGYHLPSNVDYFTKELNFVDDWWNTFLGIVYIRNG